MRRFSQWWTPPVIAATAIVGACLVAAAVLGGPIAKRVARARAASLGVNVEIDSARLGWGVVRFRGVSVTIPKVPAFAATFDCVDATPSVGLSLARLDVVGGKVRIEADDAELERQVKAFRAARPDAAKARGPSSPIPASVSGVDVVWLRGAGPEGARHAWGIGFDRDGSGNETFRADLLRAAAGGARAEVQGARVALVRRDAGRHVTSANSRAVNVVFDLDGRNGPEAAPPATDPAAPGGATEAPDWGPELRRQIGRFSSAAAELFAPGTSLEVPRVRLQARRGADTLNVGPATLLLARSKSDVRVALVSGAAENATPLQLAVTAPLGAGPVEIELTGGPIALSALGVKEHDMGLEDVARAEVEVAGKARLSEDGRAVFVSGHSRLKDLSLVSPRLAPEPVRGLGLSIGGEADLRTDGSRVTLKNVSLGVGKVRLETRGEIDRADGHARGKVHFGVPLAACSDLFGSIPSGMMPLLRDVEVSGTFSVAGEIGFDTRRPGDTRLDWVLANECRITRVSAELSPRRFRAPWVRSVASIDDVPTTIESGPGTRDWVPIYDISPHVQTAVVVCEDARFFTHDGFDEKSIQSSIRDNLRAGKFVRGGSTVTMQLAKNLYLGREKTLSRKLQEAVLTALLEQELTKEQILELYVNVIEFAPGLYGIGPAAAHYFRTTPKELSLAQSLYLVSILPNPRIHHFDRTGALGPRWTEYLRKLMVVAHKIRGIDDRELEVGLAETVRFGSPADVVPLNGTEGADEPEGSAHPEVLDLAPRDAAAAP